MRVPLYTKSNIGDILLKFHQPNNNIRPVYPKSDISVFVIFGVSSTPPIDCVLVESPLIGASWLVALALIGANRRQGRSGPPEVNTSRLLMSRWSEISYQRLTPSRPARIDRLTVCLKAGLVLRFNKNTLMEMPELFYFLCQPSCR